MTIVLYANYMHLTVESRACMTEKDTLHEGRFSPEDLSEQNQEIINQTQG